MLIPDLFHEMKEKIKIMEEDLNKGRFETLDLLGHGFKGASRTFGLESLADIFLMIENAAKERDSDSISVQLEKALEYIDQVEIE